METIIDRLVELIENYRILYGKEPDTITLTSKQLAELHWVTAEEYKEKPNLVLQFKGIAIRVKD